VAIKRWKQFIGTNGFSAEPDETSAHLKAKRLAAWALAPDRAR